MVQNAAPLSIDDVGANAYDIDTCNMFTDLNCKMLDVISSLTDILATWRP